jgi:hypothetical protein
MESATAETPSAQSEAAYRPAIYEKTAVSLGGVILIRRKPASFDTGRSIAGAGFEPTTSGL